MDLSNYRSVLNSQNATNRTFNNNNDLQAMSDISPINRVLGNQEGGGGVRDS